jgi:hypothetical protein
MLGTTCNGAMNGYNRDAYQGVNDAIESEVPEEVELPVYRLQQDEINFPVRTSFGKLIRLT